MQHDGGIQEAGVEAAIQPVSFHHATGDPVHYRRILDSVVERVRPFEHWYIRTGDVWTYAEPPGHATRGQGWKIHVSATNKNVEDVLERVFEVLVKHDAAFKFAASPRRVRELLDIRAPRASSGKIVTVYPDDDSQFVQLLQDLDAATDGLLGPAIMSDRPYRSGSLVHYRYGGFSSDFTYLGSDGTYVPALVAPDGSWWPDERRPSFKVPPWARFPMGDEVDTPERAAEDQGAPTPRKAEAGTGSPPVLLDGRFAARGAIVHSNRGGVYRADDQHTGERVVVKQARPHVGDVQDGTDARDTLAREAAILERLAPLGIAPALVSLFDYQGHAFLAEEEVPGTSLAQWAQELARAEPEGTPPLADIVTVVRDLVAIVRAVHDEGLVLRDLKPSNLVMTPESKLVLIDVECLAEPGERVRWAVTPGYAPPEQMRADEESQALGPASDRYALGACIVHLCCGTGPLLPGDTDTGGRSAEQRLQAFTRAVAVGNPTLARFLDLVELLMAEDPDARPTLDDVDAYLDGIEAEGSTPGGVGTVVPTLAPDGTRLPPLDQERLLDDSIDWIVEVMDPTGATLWPPETLEGVRLDPLAAHGGAAGQVEVLRRALAVRGDERLREPLAAAVRWLGRRLEGERLLPGLHFGRAGTAWALHDAAHDLGDEELAGRAADVARRLPIRWFNVDPTHGLSGSGLANLHLWRRTGDGLFAERALRCADETAGACERRGDEVLWPVPTSPSSALAGAVHYGFAHGVAGVGTFLLAVGRALDRSDHVDLAYEAAQTLAAAVQWSGDAADWPMGPFDKDRDQVVRWWCNGAAGVGTFLLRIWELTGEQRFRDLAHGACIAVRRERWLLPPGHCHGVAGSGELLLDAAAVTGDPTYLHWAEEQAAALHARHALREGRQLVLADPLGAPVFGYGLGLAGVTGFLMRLVHGGTRCFMVDSDAFALDLASLSAGSQPTSAVGASS